MTEYRYIGNHAHDFESSDGKVQMVEPGGFVELSDEDLDTPFNKELVDSGLLLDTTKKKSAPADKTATGGNK